MVNTAVISVPGVSYTYTGYDATTVEEILVDNSAIKGVYKFYFRMTASGGAELYTSEIYTLNVVCNKDSTVISLDASATLIKYVDTSTLTQYTLDSGATWIALPGTLGTEAEANINFDIP
jgi:hypothetical protein